MLLLTDAVHKILHRITCCSSKAECLMCTHCSCLAPQTITHNYADSCISTFSEILHHHWRKTTAKQRRDVYLWGFLPEIIKKQTKKKTLLTGCRATKTFKADNDDKTVWKSKRHSLSFQFWLQIWSWRWTLLWIIRKYRPGKSIWTLHRFLLFLLIWSHLNVSDHQRNFISTQR